MIDFVGVAWAWSSLSELLAYPNGSRFPLGQRGSDNRGWTVHVASHTLRKMGKSIVVCGAPGFRGMVGQWTRLNY